MRLECRAYSKKFKKMIYQTDYQFDLSPLNGSVWKESIEDNAAVFMFWSNLFDKNGQKIFKGDILNLKTTVDNNLANKQFQDHTKVLVGFENGCFVDEYTEVTLYKKIKTVTSFKSDIWTSFEIIGNIYENPELL